MSERTRNPRKSRAAKTLEGKGISVGQWVHYTRPTWVGGEKQYVDETSTVRVTGIGEGCVIVRHKGYVEFLANPLHLFLKEGGE